MRSIRDFKTEDRQNVSELKSKYEGLSENELMGELTRAVSSAKTDGSFSPEQLDEFVDFVSSSLDEQSVARLKELVEMIKNS